MKEYYTERELKGLNLKVEQMIIMVAYKARLKTKLMQLRQFVPEATLYYCFCQSKGERSFVNCRIGFIRSGLRIFLLALYQIKSCYFFIDYDAYPKVSKREIENLPFNEPKHIEVFTQKNIDAWIDYLLSVHNRATELSRERAQKI